MRIFFQPVPLKPGRTIYLVFVVRVRVAVRLVLVAVVFFLPVALTGVFLAVAVFVEARRVVFGAAGATSASTEEVFLRVVR